MARTGLGGTFGVFKLSDFAPAFLMIASGKSAYPLRRQLHKAEKVSGLTPVFKFSSYASLHAKVKFAICTKIKSDKCCNDFAMAKLTCWLNEAK